MTDKTTTATIYAKDRNTLERIMRKIGKKKLRDSLQSVLKLIKKFKIEGELE